MSHEFEALSGKILEAAVAVHKAVGPGFLESIYQKAVGLHRLDLVVSDQIILELKAVKALEDIHFAQLRSYLKATGLRVGLLLNFNAPTLIIKRVVL